MFFIDEEKIDVIKLFNDTKFKPKFKPKYNEDTGQIYKFTSQDVEFVKNGKIWEMKILSVDKDQYELILFITFKFLDGILDNGFINEDGNKEILRQEILKLKKPEEFYFKNKDYYKEV